MIQDADANDHGHHTLLLLRTSWRDTHIAFQSHINSVSDWDETYQKVCPYSEQKHPCIGTLFQILLSSLEELAFPKFTCQTGRRVQNKKLRNLFFFLKCNADTTSKLRNEFHDRLSAGSAEKNTVKCYSSPVAYRDFYHAWPRALRVRVKRVGLLGALGNEPVISPDYLDGSVTHATGRLVHTIVQG